MSSYKNFKQTLAAFALACCCACVITGCGKQSEQDNLPPNAPEYMRDKSFMKKIDEQEKEKRGIMKRFSDARSELAEVRAKDPKSPRIAELEKLMEKLEEEHQANRRNTQRIVAEKLNSAAKQK